MAALTAFASGLTTSGMEILSQALSEVFGEVSLKELGKDDLKFYIRQSMRSSIVFVVLDSGSEATCKEVEGNLFLSDKYYRYTDDRSLALFLNEKFGLSLEVPEDIDEQGTTGSDLNEGDLGELRDRYESMLADKDGLIKSLTCTIRGLEKQLDEGGYPIDNSELTALKEENTSLRSTIGDLQAMLEGKDKETSLIESKLSDELSRVTTRLNSLKSEYESVSKELADTQVESSRKSGVIRDKSTEIDSLTKQIDGLTTFVSQHKDCDSTIASLNMELSTLKSEVDSKESLIEQLQKELSSGGKVQTQLEEYKLLLSEKQGVVIELTRKLAESQDSLLGVSTSLKKVTSDYESTISKLEKSDSYISELNEKNIELMSRVRVLEKSTDRDSNLEDTLSELAKLRRDYTELQGNIFNSLYLKALPKSSSRVLLFNTVGLRYENIRFVFSGSTESRKGTYRCLYNEFSQDTSGTNYLVVDAVSETYVDYVFEMNRVTNGVNWFTEGGGVQKHISQTCKQNVRVLSPGLGYINDSFFLTVDWEKRLQELNTSGYKVIVYCGDLSNMVGRVLFETFSEVGNVDIYVHGNSVGSRTMVGVSKGISNIRKATVKYFEYDPQMSRFVEIIKQRCNCEILSVVKGGCCK